MRPGQPLAVCNAPGRMLECPLARMGAVAPHADALLDVDPRAEPEGIREALVRQSRPIAPRVRVFCTIVGRVSLER